MIISHESIDRILLKVTAAGVIIIAACSFAMSFYALMQVAQTAGIIWFLTPLFPITIDVFLLIASIGVLRSTLISKPTWSFWAVLIVFTGISTLFNVSVSPSYDVITLAAHGIAPVSLCISLEVAMVFLKHSIQQVPEEPDLVDAPNISASNISPEVRTNEPTLDKVETIEHVHPVQQVTEEVVTPVQVECSPVNIADDLDDLDRSIVDIYRTSPGTPFNQVAKAVDKSRSTVTRRVKMLVKNGHLDHSVIPVHLLSIKTSEPVQPA